MADFIHGTEAVATQIIPGTPQQGSDVVRPSAKVDITETASSKAVDWQDLYGARVGKAGVISRARELLAHGEQSLQRATASLREGELLDADFELTQFQGSIPELFCCQSLGESFATVIVALNAALKNRKGAPLTAEQTEAIQRCVVQLNKQLFMQYNRALDLIDDLERHDLNVNIPVAEAVSELLLSNDH